MTPETLGLIVNITLITLFVLFFVGLLISFLIGWKRGLLNSLFRFCFMGGLAIIALFCAPAFGRWIGGFDAAPILGAFGIQDLTITNPSTGAPIDVEITSVFGTLANYIETFFELYGVASGQAASEYALSIATSLLALLSIIISSILIISVGGFLTILIWNLILKRFYPRRVVKTKRKKWLGGLIHTARYVLITLMCALPTVSIIGTFSRAYAQTNNGESDSEVAQYLNSFVSTYNNSIFSNVFFNWTSKDGVWTFDTWLMDFFTDTGTGDSIYDIIAQIGHGGGSIISNGLVTEDGFSFDPALINNADFFIQLLETLSGSDLIVYALPIALAIGLNQDAMENYIDASLIEDFNFDVQEEIDTLQIIVSDVFSSGLLRNFVNYDGEGNAIGWKDVSEIDINTLYQSMLTEENYPYFMRIFESISNSELLSRLIPIVLYSVTSSGTVGEDIATYLPSELEDYKNIDWGRNLAIIYDSLYELNQVEPNLLDIFLPSENQEDVSVNELVDDVRNGVAIDETGQQIIDLVFVNAKALSYIFVGALDKDGNPIGVDEAGRTIMTDKDGNRLENADYALFDSDLIRYAIDDLVDLLVTSLSSNDTISIDTTELESIILDMNDERAFYNFKKEFGALLNTLSLMNEYDSIVDYIMDPTNSDVITIDEEGMIVDVDENFIDGMENVLPSIDNSKILSSIVPDIIKGFMDSPDVTNALAKIGLSPANFDWEVEHIGQELALIFSSIEGVVYVSNNFMEKDEMSISMALKSIPENEEELVSLLETFYVSNILNPKDAFGNMRTDNFYNLLELVYENSVPQFDFDPSRFDVTKWENSKHLNGDYILDRNGKIVYDGEIGYIVNFFSIFGGTGIYDALQGETLSNETIGQLETVYRISDIFAAIDLSEVTKSSIADTFDYYLVNSGIIDPSSGISFSNIVNWTEEGKVFGKICTTIGKFEQNINEIDIFKVEPDLILELLDNLVDSSVFVDKNSQEFLFSNFIYDKLHQSMDSLGTNRDYFADPDGLSYSEIEKDFADANYKEAWKDLTSREQETGYDLNYGIYKMLVDINLAIDSLPNPSGNIFENLFSDEMDETLLRNAVHSFNEVDILRVPIYNAIDELIDHVSVDDFDLSNANSEALLSLDKQGRKQELDLIVDVLSDFKEVGISLDGNVPDFNIFDIDENKETFEQLLNEIYESEVFNTFKDSEVRVEENLTAFESIITYFVRKIGYEQEMAGPNQSIEQLIISVGNKHADASISQDGWLGKNGEIALTMNVVSNATPIADENGEISIDTLNRLWATLDRNGQIDALPLTNFLNSLNDSRLFFRILPSEIENAMNNATLTTSGLAFLGDVSFRSVNVYYNGDNPYLEGEIENLVAIIENLYYINEGHYTSLSSLDLDLFEETMLNLNASHIFHRSGPNPTSGEEDSFFQTLTKSILELNDMQIIIYDETSPKDMNNSSVYVDGIAKADYLINEHFKFGASDVVDYSYQEKELVQIFAVLDILQSLNIADGESMSIDRIDYLSVDTALVYDLVVALNNSNVIYDGAPNLIHQFVSVNPFDNVENGFSIDLSSANVFYHYEEASNYNVKYPESEFEFMKTMLDELKVIIDLDLTKLSTYSIENNNHIINGLKAIYESSIFHQAGSVSSGSDTVFIQTMINVYSNLGLDHLNYDARYDSDVANNASEYVAYRLRNFETSQTGLNEGNWLYELDDLKAFLDVVGENLGSTNISFDNLNNLDNLLPELGENPNDKVFAILRSLNEVDTLNNVIPQLIENQLGEITVNFDNNHTLLDLFVNPLSQENMANFRISQALYRDYELENLKNLFDVLVNVEDTSKYSDLRISTLDELIETSKHFDTILETFYNSYLLDNIYEDTNLIYDAASLGFARMFDESGLTSILFGSDVSSLADKFYSYSLMPNFSGRSEGEGINKFFLNTYSEIGKLAAIQLSGNILGFDSLNLESIFNATFDSNGNRAYVSLDLSIRHFFSYFEDIIDTDIRKVTNYQSSSYEDYKDLTFDDYLLLVTPETCEEIRSLFDMFDYIDVNDMITNREAFIAALENMGHSVYSDYFYLAYFITPLNNTYPGLDVFTNYINPFGVDNFYVNLASTLRNL